MDDSSARRRHWDDVYARRPEDDVSWFELHAATSLELIDRCSPAPSADILDVGGGASRLVDGLIARGFESISVLDVSSAALAKAQERLGTRARGVRWITTDVTTFEPSTRYAIWHDRAAFHFLTSPSERRAYVSVLERAVAEGGHVIVGTFAPDGPERCSGLDVVRYDGPALATAFGPSFELLEAIRYEHVTPGGKVQPFTFARLVRADGRGRGLR